MSSDQVLARDAPREPADGFPLGEAAVQRSLDAARELERVLGPDHPDTLNARDSRAAAYLAAGRAGRGDADVRGHRRWLRETGPRPEHSGQLSWQRKSTLAAPDQDADR